MTVRDAYQIQLAAHPPGASKVTVLDLDLWQQAALDRFVAEILTDRQWRAIDNGVLRTLTDDLHQEAEQHLKGT